ncbi:cell wall hydrolase [Sphingomonas daechungensis]|uniref:Cell wall hydrolase n=1 Tax=Sphingomonas daechungensis TaxID=1176646 RepID=A0ABX6T0B5_9SPHN|nr:cell wall hydrolase [Sphingomonas daechungensis]QNP43130.1 cell wall hydrolase [Sphingomonas daechungensis]
MKKTLGGRALAAAASLFLVAVSNQAVAAPLNAMSAGVVDSSARPLGGIAPAINAAANSLTAAKTAAVATITSAPRTASSVTSVAMEAAWLYQNGWPLYALVDRYSSGTPLDQEGTCLATAVYFEARGESLEGQLAVAKVVMNRAASGQYPSSWCATVKQPWQFSFVRGGQFPVVDTDCEAWRKAQGVARLAISNAVPSVSNDVLWYHANYVAPSWGAV